MFDGYIICGTPRTGSTLLCGLLASTKRAGDPNSFFRRQSISEWSEEWGLPPRDSLTEGDFCAAYLAAAIKAGKGGTGIFGLRLMRENLEELDALLDRVYPGLAGSRARFEKAFGHILYIHLAREDRVAQAVSLVRAQQTGLWHVAPDGTEIERIGTFQEPRYDFEAIHREVTALENYEAAWLTWFGAQGIEPLRVGYEKLSASPAETLIQICEVLGVDAPDAADIKPGVAKLADETSTDWMRRYRIDPTLHTAGPG